MGVRSWGGKVRDIEARIKSYEAITIEDVYEAVRELFSKKNLNIIIYGTPPVKI